MTSLVPSMGRLDYVHMCVQIFNFCIFLSWYIGARPVLSIADVEMLKVILVKEFDTFVDREVSQILMLPYISI